MNIREYGMDEIENTPYTKVSVFSYANLLHSHVFFEFMLVLNGHCISEINGGPPTILEKGDLILIRPGDYHRITPKDRIYSHRDFYVTTEKMQRLCTSFSDDFYTRMMSPIFKHQHKLLINEFSSITSKALFLGEKIESENSMQLDYLHSSIIIQLLANMFDFCEKQSQVPQWLYKLHLELSQFYWVDKTIDEIIKKTSYTHGYVCRKFKEYYGTTLISFHNRNKIIFSQTLLGKQKIIDIAYLLNWENPKNYSIEFKKVYGISPSEYVKKLKKQQNLEQ